MTNDFSMTDFLTMQSKIGIIKNFFLENKFNIKSQSKRDCCIENNLVFYNYRSNIFKIFFKFIERQDNSYKNQKSDKYQLILLTFPEIGSGRILLETSFFFLLPKKIEKYNSRKIYSELAYFFIFKDNLCYYYQFPFGDIGFIVDYWFDKFDSNFDYDNLVFSENYRETSNLNEFCKLLSKEINVHNLPIKYLSKNILFKAISRIETLNKIKNKIEEGYSRDNFNLENLFFWKNLIELPLEIKYIIFNYFDDNWSILL